MGFFEDLRKLLDFPLGGLVVIIVGFIVFLLVLSFILSSIRRV